MTQDVYGQMREAVQRVARARETEGKWKQVLDAARARFESENVDLLASLAASNVSRQDAELMLKVLVGAHYDVTGEKKPVPGVQVKERTKYAVTDPAAALAWARQSRLALIPEDVDEKAVLKIASVTPLPFVTVTTEPQVNIDSILPAEGD